MDPFSLTIGTLTLVETALSSISTLLTDLNNIRNAPSLLTKLRSDLAAVHALLSLSTAQTASKLKCLQPDVRDALERGIALCQNACESFEAKLRRWTRRSDTLGEEIHWKDRVAIGVNERAIRSLSEQLQCCKMTLGTVLGAAVFLSTTNSKPITETTGHNLQTKEDELSQQLTKLSLNKKEVEAALYHATSPPNHNTSSPNHNINDIDHASLLTQLHTQNLALDAHLTLLETLSSHISQQHTTTQKISNVEMSDRGRVLVGYVNCDEGQYKTELQIEGVRARGGGRGVVGVVRGLDVDGFFGE